MLIAFGPARLPGTLISRASGHSLTRSQRFQGLITRNPRHFTSVPVVVT